MVKTRKRLSVVFLVMSRNSVAFFWKSSPPAHRGETKARDYHSPGYSDFFCCFFFDFCSPNLFSHRFPSKEPLQRRTWKSTGPQTAWHITLHTCTGRKRTRTASFPCWLLKRLALVSTYLVCLHQVFLQMSFCSEHGLFLPQDTANFI